MSKPRFVISCPFDTYSGYGARARDIVKAIIELDKYKVELVPQKWGETSWGFCQDHPEWNFLIKYTVQKNWQQTKPDIWMQITIPNEFQPVGKYNIGLTAGIEATVCKPEWVEGLNRMNLNLVSSNFAKDTFSRMIYDKKDPRTGQIVSQLKLQKPIEVLFEGVNIDLYKPIKPMEIKTINLDSIREEFCFLFVGHWMQGEYGHDRKNVGVLIKSFYEAFKNKVGKKPALILKASAGVSSYMSRDSILDKIKAIRYPYGDRNLPNVYLLNGEFDDNEMNELYNHRKVKAMVSYTKGEGFGRPLLEFSTTGKPIIASGWSGHTDFLSSEYSTLLPGELENVHPSAANNWLIQEAKWFKVSETHAVSALKQCFKHYKQYSQRSRKQRRHTIDNYSWEQMKKVIDIKLDTNLPKFAQQVSLDMPTLNLPKLNKVK